MSATITLLVSQGTHKGKEFRFHGPTQCLIGRSSVCDIRFPNDEQHRQVSRVHCVLEIDPPCISIRDRGSRNGTFVNGQPIGQRYPGLSPEDAAEVYYPEYPLADGDEIRVADTVFRVSMAAAEGEAEEEHYSESGEQRMMAGACP
jgi:pSer/pThr/pTyr-binding forkhead associated (FHA) protein